MTLIRITTLISPCNAVKLYLAASNWMPWNDVLVQQENVALLDFLIALILQAIPLQ